MNYQLSTAGIASRTIRPARTGGDRSALCGDRPLCAAMRVLCGSSGAHEASRSGYDVTARTSRERAARGPPDSSAHPSERTRPAALGTAATSSSFESLAIQPLPRAEVPRQRASGPRRSRAAPRPGPISGRFVGHDRLEGAGRVTTPDPPDLFLPGRAADASPRPPTPPAARRSRSASSRARSRIDRTSSATRFTASPTERRVRALVGALLPGIDLAPARSGRGRGSPLHLTPRLHARAQSHAQGILRETPLRRGAGAGPDPAGDRSAAPALRAKAPACRGGSRSSGGVGRPARAQQAHGTTSQHRRRTAAPARTGSGGCPSDRPPSGARRGTERSASSGAAVRRAGEASRFDRPRDRLADVVRRARVWSGWRPPPKSGAAIRLPHEDRASTRRCRRHSRGRRIACPRAHDEVSGRIRDARRRSSCAHTRSAHRRRQAHARETCTATRPAGRAGGSRSRRGAMLHQAFAPSAAHSGSMRASPQAACARRARSPRAHRRRSPSGSPVRAPSRPARRTAARVGPRTPDERAHRAQPRARAFSDTRRRRRGTPTRRWPRLATRASRLARRAGLMEDQSPRAPAAIRCRPGERRRMHDAAGERPHLTGGDWSWRSRGRRRPALAAMRARSSCGKSRPGARGRTPRRGSRCSRDDGARRRSTASIGGLGAAGRSRRRASA